MIEELTEYINESISAGVLEGVDGDRWHGVLFNDEQYIIGYWRCEQWLEKHGVSAWDAISLVKSYELDNYGEVYTDLTCPEKIANMVAYIAGESALVFHILDSSD
tara:strand:+ start:645 stop:959 length:315 start_codon:yes stop_codon:yes gene_type:complete